MQSNISAPLQIARRYWGMSLVARNCRDYLRIAGHFLASSDLRALYAHLRHLRDCRRGHFVRQCLYAAHHTHANHLLRVTRGNSRAPWRIIHTGERSDGPRAICLWRGAAPTANATRHNQLYHLQSQPRNIDARRHFEHHLRHPGPDLANGDRRTGSVCRSGVGAVQRYRRAGTNRHAWLGAGCHPRSGSYSGSVRPLQTVRNHPFIALDDRRLCPDYGRYAGLTRSAP